MDVLIHISQQLSNSTTLAYTPTEFTISPSIAAVNVLFFLSLALVLIDAFLAMLVKSWLQEFDRGWRKYTVANLRAKERERRLQGLERWKLAELVALLPILIQASLLLFCIGLLVLLFPIHLISAIISSVALLAGLTFYVFTTCVSIFDSYAPFSSPVSSGLKILIKALQTTCTTFACNIQGLISHIFSYISHPVSPQEHEATLKRSTVSLPQRGSIARSLSPPGNKAVKNRGVVPQSQPQSQNDYQTYASILERLVTTTPQAVENIPVFLDLLDQPVKDLTLRPSNLKKWKELLDTTVGLLGDPTFSDSATRTIVRTLMFCYHRRDPAGQKLFQRFEYHFDHMSPVQTDKNKPLNFLFASYFRCYSFAWDIHLDQSTLRSTIASLEPSIAADMELFWMVNTFHSSFRKAYDLDIVGGHALQFLAAVLTYVSSTEQSRRSQVPLTASVIHVMHTIKSALDIGRGYLDRHYLLPGTVLTTTNSESMFEAFHQEDVLNLWSDQCVELSSALLQPHTCWPRLELDDGDIWKFQLPLIAALHIDSTKASARPSTTFTRLLRSTNIPDITEATWDWACVYNKAKFASYWHMALFREIVPDIKSPISHIAYVIIETIHHCSELRLSALLLLDFSVRQLCIIAPSSLNLLRIGDNSVELTTPGNSSYTDRLFNHWILLHLDTLFPHSSLLHVSELEQLDWADTPEQLHIAKARLACYDALQGDEHKETKQLNPEPHLLKLFLWSTDYSVCTIAFKWCIHLTTVDQPSSAEDIHSTGMFTLEVMGCQWIKHLGQVLCGNSNNIRSWRFLEEHLAPKWDKLPHSWCSEFAFVFLFSTVHLPDGHEQPVYQCIAKALINQGREEQFNQGFLPFLGAMLELIKHCLNLDQLTPLETWLSQLPDNFKHQDANVKLGSVLATQRQHMTLGLFAELPMSYPELMNDVE